MFDSDLNTFLHHEVKRKNFLSLTCHLVIEIPFQAILLLEVQDLATVSTIYEKFFAKTFCRDTDYY